MKEKETTEPRQVDDKSRRRTVDKQARPTSQSTDQNQNGSAAINQAVMGMRGKDRAKGRQHSSLDQPLEEGVLVTTRSSDDDGSSQEGMKRKSFRRSRGALLAIVFMALLLDETLMTIIVPVLPDYFLNLCIGNKCLTINNTSPECDLILGNTNPDDNILSTLPILDRQDVEATSNPKDSITSITSTTNEVNRSTSSDMPDSSSITAPSFEEVCSEEITPKIGILFASKFILRIILSPFIGTMAHKIGFSVLLLSGCVIMLASSLVFAFGITYEVMLTARIIHGLGATLNEIGGLGILAYKYRNDEKKRGFAFGLAIGGFAAGTLIGPPLGGITYDFLGKEAPFLIMAGFFIALGVLELIVFCPHSKQRKIYTNGSPVYKLVLDPYILGTAGALMIASGAVALLEPTLPIWMRHTIKPTPDAWQLGAVFLPSGVSYILSSTVMGYLGYKLGRWALSMFALVVLAASVAAVPYTSSFLMLVGPMVGIGFGFGTVDSAMTAMLNSRVDARHKGAYGGAAAISTFAFCLGFAIGPSVSGFLINAFGFKWLMRGIGVMTCLYAPICICLRRPGNTVPNTRNNNNGSASRSHNDLIDDAESIPIPSISRRLSRV
ncbi:synaptic vesicular amine transporter-like [Asterias amurensis]|uniref:synaptic vesicular amine transporter-like n=1 Tax=Asterias amurensis TaxID=7602 RepID=UPI003AB36377